MPHHQIKIIGFIIVRLIKKILAPKFEIIIEEKVIMKIVKE